MVHATPKTPGAKAWLLTIGNFGRVHEHFLRSHSDRDHRLDLVEMYFGLGGFHTSERPYIAIYVGSEHHAKQTAEEISSAIHKAGGSLAEFDIGSYYEEYVA